jgi:hypothetical protein
MHDLYFSRRAMLSCVGFLLRHNVMVSYLVVNIINIGFDLITLFNNKNYYLPHRTMGDTISFRSVIMSWVKLYY